MAEIKNHYSFLRGSPHYMQILIHHFSYSAGVLLSVTALANNRCARWYKSCRPFGYIFLSFICIIPFSTYSQQFKAEGRIIYGFESIHRTNLVSLHFVILRSGDQWKIRTFDEKLNNCATCTNSVISFYEAGSDGTNIFFLEQQDLNKLKMVGDSRVLNSDGFVTAMARVETNPVPFVDIDLINFIWQAYASKSYYLSLNNGKALSPLFVVEGFAPIVYLPVKWSSENAFFVKEIDWLSDGTYIVTKNNKPEIKRYGPPYSDGFIQAHFQNLTWTNFNNLSVPATFTLAVYTPAGVIGGLTNFHTVFHISGFLETIQGLDSFSFLPTLTTKTLVKDFRYIRNGAPVGYRTTSQWYSSDEDIRRYMASRGSTVDVKVSSNYRRILMLTIMGTITIISAIVIFLKGTRTKS